MSLLDRFFGTPDQTQALGLLGAQMMAGNAPQGFLAANQHLAEAPMRAMKKQLLEAQIAETMAQANERKTVAAQRQAELEQAARIRAGLPGLYRSGGMSGGQAMPQTFAGTDVPMFSKPAGVAPMRQEPGGFDVQGALSLGITDPDKLAKYAGLANVNRPKATRQMEVDDGRGGKRVALVDDFGQEVAGFAGYTAPVQVNQGDRVSFVKPAPGVSLGVNQSPDSKASNALGWANNALTRRGQDLTDARAREANSAGKVPAGYRIKADGTGLEYIPGGPADPNAAKKAAPTEFQGKSATYGARAQEADKIIRALDGEYSPMAVNSKMAAGGVPLIGGALEAGANVMLPANAQKAEQAQRDFVNAVLRQESGAAISASEFENARKQYFPQPGDSKAVKEQKARNRQIAIQGFLANARPNAAAGITNNVGAADGSFDDNDPLGLRK